MTAFDPLLAGYRRFRHSNWERQRERWSALAGGQSPRVLVIACSDSRVDPSQIFDVSPGDIFVVRNVANLVPAYGGGGYGYGVAAAVEFAVSHLKVAEIVVMGHEFCGGCKAALTGAYADHAIGSGGLVARWVGILDEARDRVAGAHGEDEDAQREMEREAVRVSLANLRTFPFVKEAEAAGTLSLRGAWFGIREGVLTLLDPKTGRFAPV